MLSILRLDYVRAHAPLYRWLVNCKALPLMGQKSENFAWVWVGNALKSLAFAFPYGRGNIHLWDFKKGYIKDINFALSGM